MKFYLCALLVFAVLGGAFSVPIDSSEEDWSFENLHQAKRQVFSRAEELIESGLASLGEEVCKEENIDLKAPLKEVYQRMKAIDLESATVCALIKDNIDHVFEPLTSAIDRCGQSARLGPVATSAIKTIKAVVQYFCSITGEQILGSDANGGETCSIYGMKTDGVPGRINVGTRPYTMFVFNHIQWNCTYAYLTGNDSRITTNDNKFYNNYGFYYRGVTYWNELYSAEGSAVGEKEDLWQIMNYKNYDNAEIFKLVAPALFIEEYIELPVKRATYLAYGNEEMNVLYVTTRKNESDTDANAGGLYKVEGIGVTGLPKYVAMPEGTEVDYCSNPLLSTTTITTTTTTPEPTTTAATTPATTSAARKQGDEDDFCNCYFQWLQYYNVEFNVNVQASYRQAQITNGASQTDQIEPDVNKVPDISEYLPTFCLNYVKYFSDFIQNYQKYVQQYSQTSQPNYQDYSKYGQGSISGNPGVPNDYYKNAMKIVNCIQKPTYKYWNTENNWG